MSFEFSFKFDQADLNDITNLVTKDIGRAIRKGVRKGLNRSADQTRTAADKEIRDVYNIKTGGTGTSPKKRVFQDVKKTTGSNKVQGNDIDAMRAIVPVESKRGLNLIRFVGNTKVQQQKGKKPKQRSSVSVEVKKGKKRKSKSLFIQYGKGGSKVVLFNPRKGNRRVYSSLQSGKRINSEKNAIPQHAPSVAEMLQDEDVLPNFKASVDVLLQRNLDSAITNELAKLVFGSFK